MGTASSRWSVTELRSPTWPPCPSRSLPQMWMSLGAPRVALGPGRHVPTLSIEGHGGGSRVRTHLTAWPGRVLGVSSAPGRQRGGEDERPRPLGCPEVRARTLPRLCPFHPAASQSCGGRATEVPRPRQRKCRRVWETLETQEKTMLRSANVCVVCFLQDASVYRLACEPPFHRRRNRGQRGVSHTPRPHHGPKVTPR